MSYDINSIDIVSGQLQITPAGLLRFAQEVEADPGLYLPEGMEDLKSPGDFLDGCTLTRVPWYGEGSGRSEPLLREFLSRCDGEAALLLCWEGGDSYTGLIVRHGNVTDGAVVQTVVPKGSA